MSKLPNAARVTTLAGALWKTCRGCGCPFPGAPEQTHCHTCNPHPDPDPGPARAAVACCRAAHPEDCSPCEGAPDAVYIVDTAGDQACGCVRHAAVMLASVASARVYPGSVPGAAIEVHQRAALLRPLRFTDPARGWSR